MLRSLYSYFRGGNGLEVILFHKQGLKKQLADYPIQDAII